MGYYIYLRSKKYSREAYKLWWAMKEASNGSMNEVLSVVENMMHFYKPIAKSQAFGFQTSGTPIYYCRKQPWYYLWMVKFERVTVMTPDGNICVRQMGTFYPKDIKDEDFIDVEDD